MAKARSKEEYQALTTMEAKAAEIATAGSVEELDAMWEAWEERGLSREGLLYASVLARKAELGAELTEEEEATIELAEKKRKEGSKLPPITGRGKGS